MEVDVVFTSLGGQDFGVFIESLEKHRELHVPSGIFAVNLPWVRNGVECWGLGKNCMHFLTGAQVMAFPRITSCGYNFNATRPASGRACGIKGPCGKVAGGEGGGGEGWGGVKGGGRRLSGVEGLGGGGVGCGGGVFQVQSVAIRGGEPV